MTAMPEETPIVLPEPVRHRVVALTAGVLGEIEQRRLPASLRKVAGFAPDRRARLASGPIASELASDDAFRERVAVALRQQLEPILAALSDDAAVAADPIDVAAAAYLARPDDWREILTTALQGLEADRAAQLASAAEESETAAQLREQLDRLRTQLDDVRTSRRRDLDALRSENADLRRKLGTARARAREAESQRQQLEETLEDERAQERARKSETDAELRRLRHRLDAAAAEASEHRRQERDDRAQESMRARLLLEAVIESAQGLRRELALPPLEESPADRVDSGAAEGAEQSRTHPTVNDPARLRTLLELPRMHLIVDGYNVSKAAWPALPLERQRALLVSELGALAARTAAEVTVVFDGADVSSAGLAARGVRVRFSPAGVTADDVIGELVSAEPAGRPLVVASSDAEVAAHARRNGARAATDDALRGLLSRS